MKDICIVNVLLAALVVVPSAVAAQNFEPYTFDVRLTQSIKAERGEIMVKENRSEPDSRMIPIRFVRLASRAENPDAPIVYLAGGPGGAGTTAMRGQRWLLFDRLRDVAGRDHTRPARHRPFEHAADVHLVRRDSNGPRHNARALHPPSPGGAGGVPGLLEAGGRRHPRLYDLGKRGRR